MAEQPQSQIVIIGASAGGIEALSALFKTLPRDFPAPLVVAQHLDPRRGSHLEDIMARAASLPVRTVTGRELLEPGTIYVIPPNHYVEISGEDVQVRQDEGQAPLPSVDLLFTTAAAAWGENTIAVILSGTGNDGAAGARDVKAAGGTVIIQNPETASFPGMPLSLAPTTVDIVANLETIGLLLVDLLTGVYPIRPPAEDKQLRTLLEQLRDRSGIDFNSYKTPTITRRLQRRMAASGANTLTDYIRYLQRNPDEYQRLINSFLIKVTEFFRDPELFEYLREQILPIIIDEARARGELRVWSAGCATGEEAYSLAILISDLLGDDLGEINVRIFATDLDADAVAFARRGIYPSSTLADVPPALIERYFARTDGAYEVRKSIRALVVFGQHDLGQRAPFPRMDITLCRNVLIYFTTDLQKRALQLFAFALRDAGFLVLGKAETVSPLPEFFALEQPRLRVYRRIGERVLLPPARIRDSTLGMPLRGPSPRAPILDLAAQRQRREPAPAQSAGERAEPILLRLPVGVVVVDRRYDILTINAAARRLLGIHSEAIGDDLIHLVQHVPLLELRNAIDAAFRGEATTSFMHVTADQTATAEVLDLELRCYRVPADAGRPETVTIVVSDVSSVMRERRDLGGRTSYLEAEIERYAAQVQHMAGLNRALLAANEELTTVNAELRNANEELLVSNEEVQSATEEVETLNEELQATNEELETLNEELQATVEELNTTNDDLQARSLELQDLAISLEVQQRESEVSRARVQVILDNMSDAVLVVDAEGEAVLTNAAFQAMFDGRDDGFLPEAPDGLALAGEAMLQRRVAAGESYTAEFTLTDASGARRWFEATARPIGDPNGEPRGMIVIRDVTDRSLRRMQEEFLALASHELRSPLTTLTGNLQLAQRALRSGSHERIPGHVDTALMQARQLATLVSDLADTVRLQTGRLNLERSRGDLREIARETVEAAQLMAQGQTIRLEAPDGELDIDADRTRIGQVLMNLLTNAITYAPDTEAIDVRLARLDVVAEARVRDYGPGIPEEERERIFSRFFQIEQTDAVDRHGGGLGLGLFIAREIVEAHGGSIGVEAADGGGAVFIVRLPLAGDS